MMACETLSYGRWRGAQPACCWDDGTDNDFFLRDAVRSRRAKVSYTTAATGTDGTRLPNCRRRGASAAVSKTVSGKSMASAARGTAWAQTSAASAASASSAPTQARARKKTTCRASAQCLWAMRAEQALAPSTSRRCHGRASGCGCAASRWVLLRADRAVLPMTLMASTLSAAADRPCA